MPYGKNSDLPASVKKALPGAAQSVFRAAFNAFMARNEEASEERAFQVAWAAVKRGWKKQGETWVKKADAAGDVQMDELEAEVTAAYDAAEVVHLDGLTETVSLSDADVRETADGYLTAFVRSGRTGIQTYRGSEVGLKGEDAGRVVRVYRPPEEVFHQDAMHSYAHRPITLNHPPKFVDAKNWREFTRGATGGDVVRDGEFVRVPLVLMDSEAVGAVRSGEKKELSWGYSTDLRWTPGVTMDGEEYDAVQTAIRANHLAVVSVARGGDRLVIGDDNEEGADTMDKNLIVDGVTLSMNSTAAEVVQRALDAAAKAASTATGQVATLEKQIADAKVATDKQIADLTAAVSTKDGEIAVLKKQVEDGTMTPQKLDQMVAERQAVADKARAILGDSFKADGKSIPEIRREVVVAKLGDSGKALDDAGVIGAFSALTADSVLQDRTAPLAQSLSRPGYAQTANDERQKAFDEGSKYLAEAWKGKAA